MTLFLINKMERPAMILVWLSFLVALISHFIGGSFEQWINRITPIYLIIISSLLIVFYKGNKISLLFYVLIVYILSMLLEIYGVASGVPFGPYSYGETLGPTFKSVPLVIGINWFLCVFTALSVSYVFRVKSTLARSFFGAALVLLLDIPLEIICEKLDYWHWQVHPVPIRNYITWYLASFVFIFLHDQLLPKIAFSFAASTYFGLLIYFTITSGIL